MKKNLKKSKYAYMCMCVCMNHFAIHLKQNVVDQLYFNLKITKKK